MSLIIHFSNCRSVDICTEDTFHWFSEDTLIFEKCWCHVTKPFADFTDYCYVFFNPATKPLILFSLQPHSGCLTTFSLTLSNAHFISDSLVWNILLFCWQKLSKHHQIRGGFVTLKWRIWMLMNWVENIRSL